MEWWTEPTKEIYRERKSVVFLVYGLLHRLLKIDQNNLDIYVANNLNSVKNVRSLEEKLEGAQDEIVRKSISQELDNTQLKTLCREVEYSKATIQRAIDDLNRRKRN